jgi:hypothetical protein
MLKPQEFEVIERAIREHVPKLAQFIDYDETISDYSSNLYNTSVPDRYLERQTLVKKAILKQCAHLFGDEAKTFRLNLDGPVIANIVDHNGILNHPVLLSSHIISSADSLFENQYDILSLNTALYPFNSSFYDRGLGYQDKTITFISKSKSHQMVYYAPALDFKEFPDDIRNILSQADTPPSAHAWEQACRMNYRLWPQVFEESLRPKLPKLITLNQDEVVKELLSELIGQEDNFVHAMIFDEAFRLRVKEIFKDTTGAWTDEGKGSFLFWAVDEKNEGVPLKLEGNRLVSRKEGFAFDLKLDEADVLKALEENKIYPGMVLLFGALVFYAGVVPLCGYGSINYLNIMRDRWLTALKDTYPEEWTGINDMKIDKLIGGPVLTYYRDEQKRIKQAYMLDVVMRGGLKKDYLQKIFSMRFNDLLLAPLIDIYHSYIPSEHRQAISIKPHDVISEQLSWLE